MNKKTIEVRDSMIREIKDIMSKYALDCIDAYDLDEGTSPIISEDKHDDNNTYTLDRVFIREGSLFFDGGSSCSNYTWGEDDIPTDALCDIAEFLSDNEDELAELSEGDE